MNISAKPYDAEIRPLRDDEIDQANGGLLTLLWFAYCTAVGVAAGYAIAGGSSGQPSAPGDYPIGPKNTG